MIYWSSQSEKTLLMSTPKCPGDHICQIYLGKSDGRPPRNLPGQRVNFSIFRFTWVKPTMNHPSMSLKQKLDMVYSFTFYAALYMLSLLSTVSFGVGQVDRSVMHLFQYKMYQSISLLFYYVVAVLLLLLLLFLLLCITQQHP